MNSKISSRDWEALSAYLDDALPPREQARLETRLGEEPALQEALASLERTRSTLRAAPRLRAPRNFTLTPEMVAPRPSLWDWLRPTMQWSSAVAALLLVLVVAGRAFLPLAGGMNALPAAPEVYTAPQEAAGERVVAETPPPGEMPAGEPLAEGKSLSSTLAMDGGESLSVADAFQPTLTPAPAAPSPTPLPAPAPVSAPFPWGLVEGVLAFIALACGAAAWYLGRRR